MSDCYYDVTAAVGKIKNPVPSQLMEMWLLFYRQSTLTVGLVQVSHMLWELEAGIWNKRISLSTSLTPIYNLITNKNMYWTCC